MNKQKAINWGPAIFLITYQTLLLTSLPLYFLWCPLHAGTIIASILLLCLTGLSITGGYHRYFAHKTYKTNRVIECVLLFFASMAGQGSALRWSFDHRLHHAHVDTDEDPYSIKKGFWYAHFLWLLEKPRVIDKKVVPDLFKNRLVMLQHRFGHLLMVITNILAFFFVGWITQDYWGAFFLACWLRLFVLHHFTWFINSLAHTWGDKPFSQEQSAVNNYLISFLTFGEGYHNYHHTFANDYRNGIQWFHFDPTKWLIWTLSKLGLAHNLKRVDALTIKKRLVTEQKSLLLQKLSQLWIESKEELENQVQEVSNRLMEHINYFYQLAVKYDQLKQDALNHELVEDLQREIREIKKNLKDDWRSWTSLSEQILSRDSFFC